MDSTVESVSLQPPVGTPSSTAVAPTTEPMEELGEEATNTTEGKGEVWVSIRGSEKNELKLVAISVVVERH